MKHFFFRRTAPEQKGFNTNALEHLATMHRSLVSVNCSGDSGERQGPPLTPNHLSLHYTEHSGFLLV